MDWAYDLLHVLRKRPFARDIVRLGPVSSLRPRSHEYVFGTAEVHLVDIGLSDNRVSNSDCFTERRNRCYHMSITCEVDV